MKNILAAITEIANKLDEYGLEKEASALDNILVKLAQEKKTYHRVTSNTHVSPEIRNQMMMDMFTKDTIDLVGDLEGYRLEKVNRKEIPMLGQHWVRTYNIPDEVYTDPSRVVMIWSDEPEEEINEDGPPDSYYENFAEEKAWREDREQRNLEDAGRSSGYW